MAEKVWIGIGGAIGGAILTLGTQVGVEAYKNQTTSAAAEAANKQAALDALVSKYDELGDIPRRAGGFIENGLDGNSNDVRAMARHFRRLMDLVAAGRVSATDAGEMYGGRLIGWSDRFSSLGDSRSPVSAKFSATERYNYKIIGVALDGLAPDLVDEMTDAQMREVMRNQTMLANDTAIEGVESATTNTM